MNLFFPSIAHAEELLSIKQLMFRISYYIINPLIVLGFVVALVVFIWGIIDFLRDRNHSPEKSNDGKQHMLYGTIGMIIMISAFAIMKVLANIVGAGPEITNELP
jgi:ABC-type phosphate transport system permease subunit